MEQGKKGIKARVAHKMRVLDLLNDLDVVELDVKILVDAFQRPANLNVVLKLHRHLMVDEGLEKTSTVHVS